MSKAKQGGSNEIPKTEWKGIFRNAIPNSVPDGRENRGIGSIKKALMKPIPRKCNSRFMI